MALTVDAIRAAASDQELFDLLSAELNRVLPNVTDEELLPRLKNLSPGLRAMAATWDLDVSMALDALADHFCNHCNLELYEATLAGLQELGASEEAALFEKAFRILAPHWLEFERVIASPDESPSLWLLEMDLEDQFHPLNMQMWELCGRSKKFGLMQYWIEYARRYPERCVGSI